MANYRFGLVTLLIALTGSRAYGTSFRGLGDLPGRTFYSHATAVSADGSFVVGSSDASLGSEAFVWSTETGMVGLGDLPGGPFGSNAQDISADGRTIVGNGRPVSVPPVGFTTPVVWVDNIVTYTIESLPGFDAGCSAEAIASNALVVVGGCATFSTQREAYYWTQDEGMIGLGDSTFDARDVSADGAVIVGFSIEGKPYRWTAETGAVTLASTGVAYGVSPDGTTVVGWYQYAPQTENDPKQRPFRWTEDGGMLTIDGPYMRPGASRALATSENGDVVVGEGAGFPSGSSAFIWTEDLGLIDLESYLINNGLPQIASWILDRATEVSFDGRTIVGDGIRPGGRREGWIVSLGDTIQPPNGDVTNDGRVDLDDLNAVRNQFGIDGLGDANWDGLVDLADLNLVRNHFGATSGAHVVSEPASTVLLFTCVAGLCLRLRRPEVSRALSKLRRHSR